MRGGVYLFSIDSFRVWWVDGCRGKDSDFFLFIEFSGGER